MTRYTKTMAQAYKEVNEKLKVKEQENDPVQKAQDKLDKAKQIAQLKKQIDTIKKEAVDSDDTGGAAEVDMIMNQVNQMRHFLDGIEKMVQDDGDVEEWVQGKITKATDYLKTAYSYKTGEKNEDKDMDPAKHVARSKRNPDKFCVFDKDGNEVKLFDKEADAIAYAKANHDKLMEELNEFKKMIVTVNNPSKRKEMMKDIMRFGKHTGFRIDKMRDGSFKIDGKGADLNKFAIDMKNYYGATIKAESYEPLEEFTDAQIARLKKEYEPLKGKETGIALNKFDKLRKILKRLQKPQLLKLVKADLPIVSSAAKARLVINHGMKWSQLPEELVPYIDVDMLEEQKSKFKSVDPKVLTRVSKMMRGSKEEKQSLANLMNYLMPPEVVDMIRDKSGIKMPRGKIKFTDL